MPRACDLRQMLAIARPRATLAQASRDRWTGISAPSAARFRGRCRALARQAALDVAVAQSEAEIEPDGVLDDLGREAVAAVAQGSHADILPDTPLASDPVSVTMSMLRLTPPTPSTVSWSDRAASRCANILGALIEEVRFVENLRCRRLSCRSGGRDVKKQPLAISCSSSRSVTLSIPVWRVDATE